MVSVYVPNGRSLDNEQYGAKLDWLARLEGWLSRSASPAAPLAVCGDFNIAPTDRDVYDPARFVGTTHTSEPEREALARLEAWGLRTRSAVLYDEDRLFTWWDYRAGDFHNHRGMRIDLVLATAPLAKRGARGGSSTATPARASCPPTMRRSSSTSTCRRRPRAAPSAPVRCRDAI